MPNLDHRCCKRIRRFSAAVLFLSLMLPPLPPLPAAQARPLSDYVLNRG